MTSKRPYVVHFPYSAENSYQRHQLKALSSKGYNAHGVETLAQLLKYVMTKRPRKIHLHWLHGPASSKNLAMATFKLFIYMSSFVFFRLLGIQVYWTVHNIINHEQKRPVIDKIIGMLVAQLSAGVVVHGRRAIAPVMKCFHLSPQKISVIDHGNYPEALQVPLLPSELSNPSNFLFFGKIRGYKGIEGCVEAFSRSSYTQCLQVSGKPHLHVAGKPENGSEKLLEELVRKSRGSVSLNPRFVSEKALLKLMAWAHVVVLPYKEILTSGSLLYALSAGRPVIVPSIGTIPDYADKGCCFLYDPVSENIEVGIHRALTSDSMFAMSLAARRRALSFDWSRVGDEMVRFYSAGFGE